MLSPPANQNQISAFSTEETHSNGLGIHVMLYVGKMPLYLCLLRRTGGFDVSEIDTVM